MQKKTFQGLMSLALKGRSQAKLAERLGCSQQAVSGYVLGIKVPPRTRTKTFARVLGVKADELAEILEAARQKGA